MVNSQLAYWMLVVAIFVAVPLLLTRRPSLRRASGDRLSRLGVWALEQVTTVAEPDPVAQDLFSAIRRERLRADIQRLQRILASDATMSATRQLANRLAYEWLLRDLSSLRAVAPAYADAALDQPAPSVPVRMTDPGRSQDWRQVPEVEILEIGWRR